MQFVVYATLVVDGVAFSYKQRFQFILIAPGNNLTIFKFRISRVAGFEMHKIFRT